MRVPSLRRSDQRAQGSLPVFALVLVAAFGLASVTALASGSENLQVPFLSGRVVDEAQILDEATEARLTAELQALQTATGAQVAVLTLQTLGGEPLEDFSIRVVETWKLGRAAEDDGLLILVVRDDRKIRIEVGYGLEGTIPDLAAQRIIDQLMVPRFREGDFAAGIEAAVASVSGAIRGDTGALPPEPPVRRAVQGSGSSDSPFEAIFFLLFFSPFVHGALATRGPSGWVLYLFLTPFFTFLAMVFLTFGGGILVGVAWLVVGCIGRLMWPESWKIKPGKGGSGGGWSIGSSGGGWSSGGGGFSGGGGSFGGGGASGSW